eukprot:TRINITY_DN12112_c0_g1_i12.p2 TRINITY_DN12112_c0_g1~~TRINITY_DN12112_c0_g1_i12.p2  ORF type:complete len:347 (+),score=80.53 TRINITY_DN12112_c0_g1_i12:1316-2356(+)
MARKSSSAKTLFNKLMKNCEINPDLCDDNGLAELQELVASHPRSLLKRVVNAKYDRVMSPFHTAVWNGVADKVKLLLKLGGDVQCKASCWGDTPLHHTAAFGRVEAMQLLLAHQADVNAVNKDDATPLHIAAETPGTSETARLLLAHGARHEAKDKDGNTPLHDACREGNLAVVRLLLQYGADPNIRGEGEETPLDKLSNEHKQLVEKMFAELATPSPGDVGHGHNTAPGDEGPRTADAKTSGMKGSADPEETTPKRPKVASTITLRTIARKPLRECTVQEVDALLRKHGLDKYVAYFARADIDGNDCLSMEVEDLDTMGMPAEDAAKFRAMLNAATGDETWSSVH